MQERPFVPGEPLRARDLETAFRGSRRLGAFAWDHHPGLLALDRLHSIRVEPSLSMLSVQVKQLAGLTPDWTLIELDGQTSLEATIERGQPCFDASVRVHAPGLRPDDARDTAMSLMLEPCRIGDEIPAARDARLCLGRYSWPDDVGDPGPPKLELLPPLQRAGAVVPEGDWTKPLVARIQDWARGCSAREPQHAPLIGHLSRVLRSWRTWSLPTLFRELAHASALWEASSSTSWTALFDREAALSSSIEALPGEVQLRVILDSLARKESSDLRGALEHEKQYEFEWQASGDRLSVLLKTTLATKRLALRLPKRAHNGRRITLRCDRPLMECDIEPCPDGSYEVFQFPAEKLRGDETLIFDHIGNDDPSTHPVIQTTES